jgi:holo-[acyl-carrier protein] synthase
LSVLFYAPETPEREGSTVIYGIGVDLIEIERLFQAITRTGQRLIERLYTDAEQAYCCRQQPPYACYAARFAAKEALLKALGTGLRQHMRWRDIEVCRDDLGKPSLRLYGYLQERCIMEGIQHIHLSLAHSATCAIAQVILEK